MFHRIPFELSLGLMLVACTDVPVDTVIRPGIEVLVADSAHLLAGRRVGLVTNQTGVGRDGTHDVELLLGAGVNLTALFSPEHGFRGVLDQPNVEHGTDSATGLPVYSLYGETRAPTPAMLAEIDVLIIDLQDIGARTYTYISTALLAMRAAGAGGIPVVIADRPNPVSGTKIDGPMLDPQYASFVGMLPLPQRHGMTMGEMARFGRDVLEIGVELHVAPVDGWTRDLWFDQTALPWIRPSPNMPDLESAAHYPGLVWFEATNLSVGRGTPVAFQVIAAPWLRPAAVMALLDPDPSVVIRDTTVMPVNPPDRKFGGQRIPAIRLRVADRGAYDSSRMAVQLLAAIHSVHGDSLEISERSLDLRSGTPLIRAVAEGAVEADTVVAAWAESNRIFRARRAEYLLYPERP